MRPTVNLVTSQIRPEHGTYSQISAFERMTGRNGTANMPFVCIARATERGGSEIGRSVLPRHPRRRALFEKCAHSFLRFIAGAQPRYALGCVR